MTIVNPNISHKMTAITTKETESMNQLVERYWEKIHQKITTANLEFDGFLGGNLGLVWYYYHLWKTTRIKEYSWKAQQMVEQIFENMNSEPKLIGASFGNGAAGFGYVVTYLTKEGFLDIDLDTELADLDEYLYDTALQWVNDDFIDYLHGALGIIHYFSERLPNDKVMFYMNEIVNKVIEKAIVDEKGWRLKGYLMKPEEKEEINFSLSHGMPAFLIIILNAHQKGLKINGIEEIIKGGVEYFTNHQAEVDLFDNKFSFFPFNVNENTGERFYGNRLAWCYGDLNVVLFLYRAADFLNDAALKKKADLIGTFTLMRDTEAATLAKDSHFCHGSAGVAQFYYRLYQKTKIEPYKKGFEKWIEKTLVMVDKDIENGTLNGREGELLEGWPGVALTLQTALSKEPIDWDKAFLLW